MADEKDDELEIVEVEELPAPKADDEPEPKEPEAKDDEQSDDDEDERLGSNADDDVHDPDSPAGKNAEKRRKRREIARRARERKDAEIEALRQQVQQLTQLTSQLHGTQHTSLLSDTDSRLTQSRREIEQAEAIMAAALKAGNTDDFVAAQNLRDEARDRARDLEARKGELEKAAPQPVQPNAPDPVVANLANQWVEANATWFDPNGRDEDSRTALAIDAQLDREGRFDKRTPAYYHELTRRIREAIGEDDAEPPKRRQQPTGNSREHVPPSTRKQVYVTAERKQAMMDAGIWDDPAQRARFLKAYQDYDRNSASR